MRDKRLTYIDKNLQSIVPFSDGALYLFPTGWMLWEAAPTLQIFIQINMLSIISNVCERLFDELFKEWLKNRYYIVSGTFREIDGRKVRIRKSHLRRKR